MNMAEIMQTRSAFSFEVFLPRPMIPISRAATPHLFAIT